MSKTQLFDIRLDELSLVDDPANQHARVSIFKRAQPLKKEHSMSDDLKTQVGALTKKVEELTKSLETATKAQSDAEDTIKQLQADLATSKKKEEMKDEDKEYMDDMDDDEDKKKFLEMSPEQRALVIAKAKAGDETITVDGNEVRKSVVGDAMFSVIKSQQAQIEKSAKDFEEAEKSRVTAEATEIAKSKFDKVPGNVDERVTMLKAMNDMPEDTRKCFEKVFEQSQALATKAFEQIGNSITYTPGGDDPVSKARDELDTLVAKEMDTHKVSKSTAMQRVVAKRPDLAASYNGQTSAN